MPAAFIRSFMVVKWHNSPSDHVSSKCLPQNSIVLFGYFPQSSGHNEDF